MMICSALMSIVLQLLHTLKYAGNILQKLPCQTGHATFHSSLSIEDLIHCAADDALLVGEMRKDFVARLEAFLDPKGRLVDVLHEQNQ